MNTLLIRNLPEEVIRGIKEQAKQRGRTMEQEVRELLLGLYGQERAVSGSPSSSLPSGS
jgi:plasmid stability protein